MSHFITYHERWKEFGRRHPEQFTEELTLDHISVFRIHRDSKPLLAGEGTVTGDFNRLEVSLDEPADEVVLSYNWLDGLRSDTDGVELYPYTFHEKKGRTIDLIGIRPGPHTDFTITFQ